MGLGSLFARKKNKNEPSDLEKKIVVCQNYIKLWSEYFTYYSDSLEGVVIAPETEEKFFRIMGALAARLFEFSARMEDDFNADEKITTLLTETPTLAHLAPLSEAEYSAIQIRWHEIFIELNKTRGRLVQRLPVVEPDGKTTKKK